MPFIYLTPASISFLTQFILSLAITVFLARRRENRNANLFLLTGFFAAVTIFIGLMFLDAALSPYPRLFAVYAENTALALGLVFLIQFAYRFPRQYSSRKFEAYFGLTVSMAYLLWEAGFMVYRYVSLLTQETVHYRPYFAAYSMAFVLLLAPIAFLRQSIAADVRTPGSPPVSWMRKLWKPEGKEARGARVFVLVFGILFLLGLTNISLIFRLPYTIYNAAMSIGILVALWLFATNYINFLPGGASVQVKISVLSLTLFLALLGSAGWFIAPAYIATYRPNLADHQTLRFTPNISGGYDVAVIEFAFESELGENVQVQIYDELRNHEINFAFPFYGQSYNEIYIVNSGVISLGKPFWQPNMQTGYARTPAIFPLLIDLDPNPPAGQGGGLYARLDADGQRLIVTWDHLPAVSRPRAVFTFQVILYHDGVFDVTYNGLPLPYTFNPDATPSTNPWIRGVVSGMGEPLHTNADDLLTTAQTKQSPLIENYQLAFRRYLHNFMLPLAGIMIGGSILLVFGLPLLLHFSIIKPLASLLNGVRQMEAGDLTLEVPIQNEDEIGFLTHAFNAMAARLGQRMSGLEERFRQFFEYEPDYCYMVSPGGIVLDANPAALEILGYAKDDLVGKPLDIIYAPESKPTAEQLLRKWEKNGELLNEEIIIISRNRERRTVLLSAGAVRDTDGNLLYSLSIQRDITERVRAEEALLDLAMIEERRRVASDLHDSMTQSLHSLVLSTETAQHLHRENQSEKLTTSLEMLGDSARQTLQEMRLLLYGLSLTPDEQVDLFEILEARLESVERRLGIETELNIDNRGIIPDDCERELFFIIVEALNNALRHGRADHVWVSISGSFYQVTVTVRDNGCGFSPDQVENGGGMGIKNMTERVSSMGGLLTIDSKPGGGTTILVQINLDCTQTAKSEE